MLLKETFIQLLKRYTSNEGLIVDLWSEVERHYSSKNRHYHTLQHLENLLEQLIAVKQELKSWESVLFSLYYHDIIYNVLKSNNETKSADLAEKRMNQIAVSTEIIGNCKKQILATKSHKKSAENDTNYFTDADLSVLGESWEKYSQYYKNVRKEYFIYTDAVYNPGRKKALNHFLEMDRIFKTDYFYNKFELQAKQNIYEEILALS